MNTNFYKQYENQITELTDGMEHDEAVELLSKLFKGGFINEATLTGYKDCAYSKIYDKFWRYETKSEPQYLQGVQAAINNGGIVEQYIEVAECVAFAHSEQKHQPKHQLVWNA